MESLRLSLLGNWAAFAACAPGRAGAPDPEAFFPAGEAGCQGGESRPQDVLSTCFRCPVKVECLEYALQNEETDGIWGGKTPSERRKITLRREALERGVA